MTKSQISNLQNVRDMLRADLDSVWAESVNYNPTTPYLQTLFARIAELNSAIQALDAKLAEV